MNRNTLERTILGQVLFSPSEGAYALDVLDAGKFTNQSHRDLFTRMLRVYNEHKDITPLTIGEKFDPLVLGLMEEVVTINGFRSHVDGLLNEWSRETFVIEADKILKNSSKLEPVQILERFEPLIDNLAHRSNQGSLEGAQTVCDRIAENLEQVQKGKILGITTGFPQLDRDDLVLRNGELCILGARPSVGKSALAWQIAVQSGVNVAFFSQEMKSESLMMRQLSQFTGMSTTEMRQPRQSNIARLVDGLCQARKLKIWIDDTQGKTGAQIWRKAKRFHAIYGCGLVVVDYLQLLRFPNAQNRREGVGDCTATLKELAKELDVPVLCISSIRRGMKPNDAPTMEDLKESGDIEFHADVIFLMHRNLFDDSGKTELIKAKDRNGEVYKTELKFDKQTTSFSAYKVEFDQKDWAV